MEHCGPDGRDDRQCMRKVKLTRGRERRNGNSLVFLICFSMLDFIDEYKKRS